MKKITQITNDALQTKTIILDDGTQFTMTIYFIQMQLGWFIRELNYLDFTIKNIRITNSQNFLRQFKNIIPFGIKCESKDGREPMLIDDFVEESNILYVLNEDEVQEFEDTLSAEE